MLDDEEDDAVVVQTAISLAVDQCLKAATMVAIRDIGGKNAVMLAQVALAEAKAAKESALHLASTRGGSVQDATATIAKAEVEAEQDAAVAVTSKSIYWFSPRICSRTRMGRSTPSVFSRGGSLLPSISAAAFDFC